MGAPQAGQKRLASGNSAEHVGQRMCGTPNLARMLLQKGAGAGGGHQVRMSWVWTTVYGPGAGLKTGFHTSWKSGWTRRMGESCSV